MLDRTITMLKKDEGFRPTVYTDSRGYPTFGYGFRSITEPEANKILEDRVIDIVKELYSTMPIYRELDEVRSSVLISMVYNIGLHALTEFRSMLGSLVNKDYVGAANAMRNSLWAREVGNRAEKLALMMESGKWPQ